MRMNKLKKIDLETLRSVDLAKASKKEVNTLYNELVDSIFDKINKEEHLSKEEISIMKDLKNVTDLSNDYIKHNKRLQKNKIRTAGKVLTTLGVVGVVASLILNTFSSAETMEELSFFIPDASNILKANGLNELINEVNDYYGNLYNTNLPFKATSSVLGLGLALSTLSVFTKYKRNKVETKRAILQLYATETYKNENAIKEVIEEYSTSK